MTSNITLKKNNYAFLYNNSLKKMNSNIFNFSINNYYKKFVKKIFSNSVNNLVKIITIPSNLLVKFNFNSLTFINIMFIRKFKVFNKGRYSRTRQLYRTGVY